ncbi:MAG: HD domain-containing protein [Acidimicrobiales bacterium]|jgi:predicted HD phosphohydrolase
MREAVADRPTLVTVIGLLRQAGSMEEPNEEITGLSILHHGLQCAAHLHTAHPGDAELQVAGLLHDVGHVLMPGCADVHGEVGAAFVRPVFGERVAALIESHVPAKRFLVSVDGSYREQLSEGSLRTLAEQGESMTVDELTLFRASPFFAAAVELRRADEAAKDPGARVPALDAWLSTLELMAG